jgi:tRNA threonylcarbamoyl adenosine modification protein YeaZ
VILLAIDSGETCSAAVWDSARSDADGVLAFRVIEPARGQAERLIGLVEAVLADAGLRYDDLGALAVNHGPGSFTGLRSAVAAARGLALAAQLGVIPVSSLEALASGVQLGSSSGVPPGEVLAALDARRGEVYAQRFGPGLMPLPGARGEPRAMPPQNAARAVTEPYAGRGSGPVHLVGSGACLVQALLPAETPVVLETVQADARLVARCAARRLAAGERPVAGFAVRPLYLRAPDARPPTPIMVRPGGQGATYGRAV